MGEEELERRHTQARSSTCHLCCSALCARLPWKRKGFTTLCEQATYSSRGSSPISLWIYDPYLNASKFFRSSSLLSSLSWMWSSLDCRWPFVWRACSRLKASFLLSSLVISRDFWSGSIWKGGEHLLVQGSQYNNLCSIYFLCKCHGNDQLELETNTLGKIYNAHTATYNHHCLSWLSEGNSPGDRRALENRASLHCLDFQKFSQLNCSLTDCITFWSHSLGGKKLATIPCRLI